MAKKKEEKIKQNYNREVIDLKEFMLIDAKKQDEKNKENYSYNHKYIIDILMPRLNISIYNAYSE